MELDGGKDPRWITFHQASERELKVKKSTKGTRVTLWKPLTEADEQDKIVAVIQRFFTIFHASQVKGISEYTPPPINEIEAHETAEKIITASGATILYGGGRAFYQPSTDSIHMPPKGEFILTHWTGYSSRLKRDIYAGRSLAPYAREELVAEIGNVFISSASKIPHMTLS
ncbi:MAG: DUF1738 domain-containing protein [Synergistaceae bacterium]|nr:DUF1738 domain-containing protein [Synergistaceae bacterium]